VQGQDFLAHGNPQSTNFVWTRETGPLCSNEHERGHRSSRLSFSNFWGRTDRITANNSLKYSRECGACANATQRRRRPTLPGLEVHAVRLREAFHTASSERGRITMSEVQKRFISTKLKMLDVQAVSFCIIAKRPSRPDSFGMRIDGLYG
jgi:hypothetical protein